MKSITLLVLTTLLLAACGKSCDSVLLIDQRNRLEGEIAGLQWGGGKMTLPLHQILEAYVQADRPPSPGLERQPLPELPAGLDKGQLDARIEELRSLRDQEQALAQSAKVPELLSMHERFEAAWTSTEAALQPAYDKQQAAAREQREADIAAKKASLEDLKKRLTACG